VSSDFYQLDQIEAAGMSVDESAEVVADFLDNQGGGDHR
jgi:hypothetical protein